MKNIYAFLITVFVAFTGSQEIAQAQSLPHLQSATGIQVYRSFWLNPRTIVASIGTYSVSPGTVNGPFEVRITLPTNYTNSGNTHFPVLYLLHGSGGSSRTWSTEGGAIEYITRDTPIITVMPDGGKAGWYTNWVTQYRVPQNWETFHLNQLIPWIDQNFRTIAHKAGRAIAGNAMGGFGAIHYAQRRPDLFAFAASFSGALDIEASATRNAIIQEMRHHRLSTLGSPFGLLTRLNYHLRDHNPVRRAHRLRGVDVALYAGDGVDDNDWVERNPGWFTFQMHGALNRAGIPHHYDMYGRPGPGTPWNCNGGHNFDCWNMALERALPRMMSVLARP